MRRSATSRYKRVVALDDGSLPIWRPAEIPVHDDDRVHRVVPGQEGRLDEISRQYYGDSELWWILALASNLRNVQKELTLGRRILIPARDTVRRLINGDLSG